jgi:hypothetical protein
MIFGKDIININVPGFLSLPNKIITHINVFGSLVKYRVFDELNCELIVAHLGYGLVTFRCYVFHQTFEPDSFLGRFTGRDKLFFCGR